MTPVNRSDDDGHNDEDAAREPAGSTDPADAALAAADAADDPEMTRSEEALTSLAKKAMTEEDAKSASISSIQEEIVNTLQHIEEGRRSSGRPSNAPSSRLDSAGSGADTDVEDPIVVMNMALQLHGITKDEFRKLSDRERASIVGGIMQTMGAGIGNGTQDGDRDGGRNGERDGMSNAERDGGERDRERDENRNGERDGSRGEEREGDRNGEREGRDQTLGHLDGEGNARNGAGGPTGPSHAGSPRGGASPRTVSFLGARLSDEPDDRPNGAGASAGPDPLGSSSPGAGVPGARGLGLDDNDGAAGGSSGLSGSGAMGAGALGAGGLGAGYSGRGGPGGRKDDSNSDTNLNKSQSDDELGEDENGENGRGSNQRSDREGRRTKGGSNVDGSDNEDDNGDDRDVRNSGGRKKGGAGLDSNVGARSGATPSPLGAKDSRRIVFSQPNSSDDLHGANRRSPDRGASSGANANRKRRRQDVDDTNFNEDDDEEEDDGEDEDGGVPVSDTGSLWGEALDRARSVATSEYMAQAGDISEIGSLIALEVGIDRSTPYNKNKVIAFPPLWIEPSAKVRRQYEPELNWKERMQDWDSPVPEVKNHVKNALNDELTKIRRKDYCNANHTLHPECMGYVRFHPEESKYGYYENFPTPTDYPVFGKGLTWRKKEQDRQAQRAKERYQPFGYKDVYSKQRLLLKESVPYYYKPQKPPKPLPRGKAPGKDIAKQIMEKQDKKISAGGLKTRIDELAKPKVLNTCRSYFPKEYLENFKDPKDQICFKEVAMFLPKAERDKVDKNEDMWPSAKEKAKSKKKRMD